MQNDFMVFDGSLQAPSASSKERKNDNRYKSLEDNMADSFSRDSDQFDSEKPPKPL